jgi:hypothetical protein
MLTLYLACFVIGGFVITLSVLGGGDADLDVEVDASADVEPSADAGSGQGSVGVARLISMRNGVFFTSFFGMSGTLLTLLGAASAPTLAASIVLGLGAAAAIHQVMGYLRRSQSGDIPEPTVLAGARARVLVGPSRVLPGKVEVSAGDRTQQLVARVHAESAVDHFEPGDSVVIVRVEDGQALVAEKTFFA